MKKVEVVGRFVYEGEPIQGQIEFLPSRFWYTVGGKHYALLSPCVTLRKGVFQVELTVIDRLPANLYYRVKTPIGEYVARPHFSEKAIQLSDIVKKKVV